MKSIYKLIKSMFAAFRMFFAKASNAVLSTIFGTGNAAITYTLKGGVTTASIAHANATEKATTDVAVVGSAVAVNPGTKAMVFITGTPKRYGVPVVFPPLYFAGNYNASQAIWSFDGALNMPATGAGYVLLSTQVAGVVSTEWQLLQLMNNVIIGIWFSETSSLWPDLTDLNPGIAWCSGTAKASTATSCAAQVLTALDDTPAAEALLTFALAPGSDGTGAVAVHAAVTLHT